MTAFATARTVPATATREQSPLPAESVIVLFRSTEAALAATSELARAVGVSVETGRAAARRLQAASSNRISAFLRELSDDAALVRHLLAQAAAGSALVTVPVEMYSDETLAVLEAGGATEVYRTGRWVTERIAPRRGR